MAGIDEKTKIEREYNAVDDNTGNGPVQPYFPPSQRKMHDSDVTFEEYYYYAQQTREEQRLLEGPKWDWKTMFTGTKKEKTSEDDSHLARGTIVTDLEWTNASRAFRTASWGAAFYLVGSSRRFWSFADTN